MVTEIYGNAMLPAENPVVYSLLRDEVENTGRLGCELYGVRVEMGCEAVSIPRLTASKASVEALLNKLINGCVTPSTLQDVVNDWMTG